jgi:hypothetical protein
MEPKRARKDKTSKRASVNGYVQWKKIMPIKISTLNLCLKLPNKKNLVTQLILHNDVDVLNLKITLTTN